MTREADGSDLETGQDDAHVTATKRKPKPITAHPLFPIVTALWFATFFGLGSFAVAPSLLEGPVVALGIPALVPAAAPPLGFTARVMLALAMLLLGAVIGYVVGRKLAPREVVAPRRRDMSGLRQQSSATDTRSDEPRRPLNPVEDLGEPLLAMVEAEPAPFRRRALSLSDEGQPMVPSEDAPLPGFLPWETPPASQDDLLVEDDPLAITNLLDSAESFTAEPERPALDEPAIEAFEAVTPEARNDGLQFAEPAPFAEPPVIVPPAPIAKPLLQAPPESTTPIERAPLEGLGMVQLVERLAVAIARHAPPSRDAAPLESSAFAAPAMVTPAAPALPVAPAQPTQTVAAADEAEAQRVVRLRPVAIERPAMVEPAMAEEDFDEEDSGEEIPRFLRTPAQADTVAQEDAPAEPEVAEDRYRSLLDMGPVASRTPAPRIEDGLSASVEPADGDIEPAVVFPGQVSPLQTSVRRFERPSIQPVQGSPLAAPGRAAPSTPGEEMQEVAPASPVAHPDPDEADRALRAALATLQRMTAQG